MDIGRTQILNENAEVTCNNNGATYCKYENIYDRFYEPCYANNVALKRKGIDVIILR